jgi:putative redox protein
MKLINTKNFQIAVNEYGDSNSDKFCVLMPGRLDTKDYANFISHGNFLASLGYHVIAIDPPYTWESPGDLNDYTTSAYIQAVNELIESFGNKPTLLLGHSRGGATAMLVSAINPRIEAVVLVNAAYGSPTPPDKSKLIDGYLLENRDIPPGDKRTKEQIKFMLPMAYFEDGNKHDPVSALKSFKGAKLLVHATGDEFVGANKVKSIYNSLDEPKTYLEVNCAHDYRLCFDAIEQVNKTLKKFLGCIN